MINDTTILCSVVIFSIIADLVWFFITKPRECNFFCEYAYLVGVEGIVCISATFVAFHGDFGRLVEVASLIVLVVIFAFAMGRFCDSWSEKAKTMGAVETWEHRRYRHTMTMSIGLFIALCMVGVHTIVVATTDLLRFYANCVIITLLPLLMLLLYTTVRNEDRVAETTLLLYQSTPCKSPPAKGGITFFRT